MVNMNDNDAMREMESLIMGVVGMNEKERVGMALGIASYYAFERGHRARSPQDALRIALERLAKIVEGQINEQNAK